MKIIEESSVRRISPTRGLSASELVDEVGHVEAESSRASDTALARPGDLKTPTVEKAYRDMMRVIPPQMLINLGRRMKTLVTNQPTVAVATACSGTDIVLKILDVLSGTFNCYWGYKFEWAHASACEEDGRKQKFPDITTR